VTLEPIPRLWAVRSYLVENDEEVYLDEGPWEYYLASLVLADIGIDASIPRGVSRARVTRAQLVPAPIGGAK
jgi:hypothetical protein